MVILITIVHVIVCVFLAVVVLLQSGKAADLAGAFGRDGLADGVWSPRICYGIVEGDHHRRGSVHGDFADAVDSLDPLRQSVPRDLPESDPVTQQKGGAAQGTVPITATPIVGGQAGAPQNLNIPVNAAPSQNPNQQKK